MTTAFNVASVVDYFSDAVNNRRDLPGMIPFEQKKL
jgi:hypothetical protein